MFQKAKRDWKSLNNQNDPTAWELAKREGYGPLGYLKLNVEIMVKICLFVYIAAKVGEYAKLMGPAMVLVWMAGSAYCFWQLLKQLDKANPPVKRLEAEK